MDRARCAHGGIVCRHISEGSPVRLFSFESERVLQFVCGANNHWHADDYRLVSLSDLIESNPEIGSLPQLVVGQWAERPDESSDWIIGEHIAGKD